MDFGLWIVYIDTFSEEYYLFFLIFESDHKNIMRHVNVNECVGSYRNYYHIYLYI